MVGCRKAISTLFIATMNADAKATFHTRLSSQTG